MSNAITARGVKLVERVLHSRTLTRAPIWVYRAGLGFVFGSRMLMLEHIGRRTGATRYVVLEVIDHPDPDSYIVASGFGTRAQWFKNVQANPQVKISAGGRRSVPAEARHLTTAEADAALQSYIARHPGAWSALKPAIESTLGESVSEHDTTLPMVLFSLR
ncbi:nitroreductase family deazaflavin-dependent oxidoreductase [Mycolicibacterium tusciae]|uniref:nitroreductase family deazaflavin-dependent oxidoreductase n=1 Tax=Mycolicibacterium tusciae TaxID=75922 RepID=UPI00024A264A|nr:nitroreductase family deazaflavin-dependent oxidoreductase [Mycolicibacterium tusciae]